MHILPMFDPKMFAYLILLCGLSLLGIILSDSRRWYKCAHCGTTSGDHGEKCPFKKPED